MKRNPDNRDDNVEKIQQSIDGTVQNIRRAEEMIRATSSEKMKSELSAKNERRERALEGLRREIKEEAEYREKKGK